MVITKEEFAKIIKVLRTVYTSENFVQGKEAFDTWYNLLKDIDYQRLSAGSLKYMQTNNRVPTPADLRSYAIQATDTSEGEVWAMVSKAISNSAYNSKTEFEKLPKAVQRSVGSPEQLKHWATSDDTNMEVVQSQVLRSYRQTKARERENELTNPAVLKMLENTVKKISMEI